MKTPLSMIVNQDPVEVLVEPDSTLLTVLRDDLGLTGTKEGCGAGECGACTVIVNGQTVNSCLMLALEAEGKSITTIEGMAKSDGGLHPVQRAFIDHGAVQCGFCTPGMIMSASLLLEEHPNPSEDDIRQGIAGNLCRCTGYNQIATAIGQAAKMIKEDD